MVWMIGLVTTEELKRLREIGWEDEDPAEAVESSDSDLDPGEHSRAFYVDSSVIDVMTGPDWEGGRIQVGGDDQETSPWIPATTYPEIVEHSGDIAESADVLFTDGTNQYVGYMRAYKDQEEGQLYDPSWIITDPAGDTVEGVTHWRYLPSLPAHVRRS